MKIPRHLRLPWAMLGTMTALTLGGPLGIGAILRGGASPDWPPDRPVEWATVLGVSGLVLALMLGCIAVSLANQKEIDARTSGREGEPRP